MKGTLFFGQIGDELISVRVSGSGTPVITPTTTPDAWRPRGRTRPKVQKKGGESR